MPRHTPPCKTCQDTPRHATPHTAMQNMPDQPATSRHAMPHHKLPCKTFQASQPRHAMTCLTAPCQTPPHQTPHQTSHQTPRSDTTTPNYPSHPTQAHLVPLHPIPPHHTRRTPHHPISPHCFPPNPFLSHAIQYYPIHLNPPIYSTPSRSTPLSQVISRAYRMGAAGSVAVEQLLMAGTVEEELHSLVQQSHQRGADTSQSERCGSPSQGPELQHRKPMAVVVTSVATGCGACDGAGIVAPGLEASGLAAVYSAGRAEASDSHLESPCVPASRKAGDAQCCTEEESQAGKKTPPAYFGKRRAGPVAAGEEPSAKRSSVLGSGPEISSGLLLTQEVSSQPSQSSTYLQGTSPDVPQQLSPLEAHLHGVPQPLSADRKADPPQLSERKPDVAKVHKLLRAMRFVRAGGAEAVGAAACYPSSQASCTQVAYAAGLSSRTGSTASSASSSADRKRKTVSFVG